MKEKSNPSSKSGLKRIIVILGPTASGKSDLAVSLAKKLNGEVISADSRQVYKGLDIGTGKITRKEMRGVPHYLLDVVGLHRLRSGQAQRFSVADFKKMAEQKIEEIVTRGKLPIICGGTGHYVAALLGEQQIPEVPPNLQLRKQLEKRTAAELFKMLQKLDPRRAAEIDKNNPRRLVRAIEIAKALGKVPLFRQGFAGQAKSKYDVLKIGIKISDEELKERIKKRIDKWFKQGLLKEVQDLHDRGLSWKRMSEIGLEYRLVAQALVSRSPLDTYLLKQKMFEQTWQYAKRQMTWFKRDKEILWVDLIKKDRFYSQTFGRIENIKRAARESSDSQGGERISFLD